MFNHNSSSEAYTTQPCDYHCQQASIRLIKISGSIVVGIVLVMFIGSLILAFRKEFGDKG